MTEQSLEITHTSTILGTIPAPPDMLAQSKMGNFSFYPLERDAPLNSATTIITGTSNMHPSHYISPYGDGTGSRETIHITGIRFDDVGYSYGFLTLDSRHPQGSQANQNSASGEYPLAYALGDDCFLVLRHVGSPSQYWSRPCGMAWIIRVNELGVPEVVDSRIDQGQYGYSWYRNELLVINPPAAWTFAYDPRLVGVLTADDLGCFGFSVSPAGFGPRVQYPDPAPPAFSNPNEYEWPHAGMGINDSAYIIQRADEATNLDPDTGLYYPETGEHVYLAQVDPDDSTNPIILGSQWGDTGDQVTDIPNLFYTAYGWGGWNRFITIAEGDPAVATAAASTIGNNGWEDGFLFHLEPDEAWLEPDGIWQAQTVISGEACRAAGYYRYMPPDPPYASLQDFYDRNPSYHSSYPTYASFEAEINTFYPSHEAFLAAAGDQWVGVYVGFQGLEGGVSGEPAPWGWGIFDHPVEYPVEWDDSQRIIARHEGDYGDTWFTVIPGAEFESTSTPWWDTHLIRWDPIPPGSIYGKQKSLDRRFWR